jgi:hypothetical protein
MGVDLDFLKRLEQEHGLPDGMLEAVMQQESGGKREARSPKGALGYFQFMPDTARQYGVNPYDFTSSATGAARYLKDINKQVGGDWEKTLAGYNWGPHRRALQGEDWMDKAPEETRDYVTKISAKVKGMQTFNVELPDGTILEGIPLGTTKEQIIEKLKARGMAVPGEDLTSKEEPQVNWQDKFAQAQKGRYYDVAGGVAGGVGGGAVGSAGGPVGMAVGGVTGGALGSAAGAYANIKRAQQLGELPADLPQDELSEYLIKEMVISGAIDVALLGTGKALSPIGKTLVQRLGITEDAFAAGLNKYLANKGSNLRAGLGWSSQRAADFYRVTGKQIDTFLHEDLQHFSNSLKKMPQAKAEQVQEAVKAARKSIGEKFGPSIRVADEGTVLGATSVSVTPGMTDLFKLVDDGVKRHAYAEAQKGAVFTKSEAEQLKNILAKGTWTVGELRTLKENLQRMAAGSYDEAGKVAASSEFSDKIAKEAIRSIDQAIDENLRKAGKVAEADVYKAGNKAYHEAIEAFDGAAVRILMKEDPAKLAVKVVADNSQRSVQEARSSVAELVKLGKVDKRLVNQFDDELKRAYMDKMSTHPRAAAELWERIHPTSKGSAYSPADKAAFDAVFPDKRSKLIATNLLEANRNYVEWQKTLPEQEALGAGKVGALAIAGSVVGGAAGGGIGAGVGAGLTQAAVYWYFTKLPRIAAEAASSGEVRVLNQATFLTHYIKNYMKNLKEIGPVAAGAAGGGAAAMADKAVADLDHWFEERGSKTLGKIDYSKEAGY